MRQIQAEQRQRHDMIGLSFRILSSIAAIALILTIVFYILIHRDIRRRNSYRRKLEAADRDNRQLLALHRNMVQSILHDLRSPLGIVSGYAELARSETDSDKRAIQVGNILTSSEHMLHLTENLLEYYKLDTGNEQLSSSPFSLDKLVKELDTYFCPMAVDKGLAFHLDCHPRDTTLIGDRERFFRIASNLLSNAVKFTPAGSVNVSVNHADDVLLLQVRDTGHGMSQAEIRRVFKAFERLDNAGKVTGFGLGLPITSCLVKLMGGILSVESHPGEGSLFTVSLPMPVTREPQQPPLNVTENDSLKYPLKILLVDDDLMLQALTREMLLRRGIECDCCSDAREVMEQLRVRQYDLLITDIQMPGMDGFTLLKELRRSPYIPQAATISCLAMTARVDISQEEFITEGFAGCLYKPFTLSSLLTAVTGQDCLLQNGEDISFSQILHGEERKGEMLALFIRETRNDMEDLKDAARQADGNRLSDIIHKIRPLWMTMGVRIPSGSNSENLPIILRQGEWLVRRATQMLHSETGKNTRV